MDLEAQENPLLGDWRDEGRPSRIASYCKDAQRQGGTTCLWICFKEHGRMRAKDIQFKENETSFQFRDILKSCGWWRRFAIYSIVDVGEVQVRLRISDLIYQLTSQRSISTALQKTNRSSFSHLLSNISYYWSKRKRRLKVGTKRSKTLTHAVYQLMAKYMGNTISVPTRFVMSISKIVVHPRRSTACVTNKIGSVML